MPISGGRPIAPSSEEITQACRTRYGIANLLHELVYQALPEPWDHEMPQRMYGSYWHALLEAIGAIRDELGLIEYSHRNQLPQEYLQDEALVAVARDLEFQAEHGYRRLARLPDAQLCWVAFYPALVCLAFVAAASVPIGGLLWLAS